jgi:hypothetical protein
MWISKEVDLPEALIDAQQNGELVVFAGAGVSIGPPSNLPSFRDLAVQIGKQTRPFQENEALDVYLGKVEDDGARVHDLARSAIDIPGSTFRPIHCDLLRLFRSAESVRLITTNFDSHFINAASDIFDSPVETFFAPALPLGRDFSGIAHIHGGIAKRRSKLVLTDRDVGQANVTDGWVTRFLVEVFENVDVLFVGYSHRDPVMSYLSRSLRGKRGRYALDLPNEDGKWKNLGIYPVHFQERSDPDKFGALDEAVHAWAERAKMGALDHEQQLRSILTWPPAPDPQTADYVRLALTNDVTIRFFAEHAKTPEWLRWAAEAGFMGPLFKPGIPLNEQGRVLAHWFARTFAVEHPGPALDLVADHNGRLGPVIWNSIAWHLSTCDPVPSESTMEKWLVVLLAANAVEGNDRVLSYLLERCAKEHYKVSSRLLLECLTRPAIRVETPWRYGEDEAGPALRTSITAVGEIHHLTEAWNKHFALCLDEESVFLKDILASSIAFGHELRMAVTARGFEATSFE